MRCDEPIKLRWKKLSNGEESAFLDITMPGLPRKKEYLRLHRGGDLPKKTSRENERLAMAIWQKRSNDYKAGLAGEATYKTHRLFFACFEEWANSSDRSDSTRLVWSSAKRNLKQYLELKRINADNFVFADITPDFCKGYLHWLKNDATTLQKKWKGEEKAVCKKLSSATVFVRFSVFKTCLQLAIKEGIIAVDPSVQCDAIKKHSRKREYLSAEELRKLIQTPYTYEEVCKAFVFACLTGMRISDVRAMRWDNVSEYDGHRRITFNQVKTKGLVYLDISDMAKSYMPERSTGYVFDLPAPNTITHYVHEWLEAAGIHKHITFHCARHTAAVMMLSAGAEIYTVSKVLGHSSVATTQVYSDIIDKKKAEAVDLIANMVSGTAEGQNSANNGK